MNSDISNNTIFIKHSYTCLLSGSLDRLTISKNLCLQATLKLNFQESFIVITSVICNCRWTWKIPKISPKYQPDVELPLVPLMGKMPQHLLIDTWVSAESLLAAVFLGQYSDSMRNSVASCCKYVDYFMMYLTLDNQVQHCSSSPPHHKFPSSASCVDPLLNSASFDRSIFKLHLISTTTCLCVRNE